MANRPPYRALQIFILCTLPFTALQAQTVDAPLNDSDIPDFSPVQEVQTVAPTENKKVNTAQEKPKRTTLKEIRQKERIVTQKGPEDHSRIIRLKVALEEGLRENPQQKYRNIQKELFSSRWDDTFETFWLPRLQIEIKGQQNPLGRIRPGPAGGVSSGNGTEASAGLSFGDYTIFNWGKDYLNYQSDRAIYDKNLRNLNEYRRNLKHMIITKYFELAMTQSFERIYRDQLQHTTFIYRLGRELVTQKKISTSTYLLSRAEYLRARSEYQKGILATKQLHVQLALALGDKLDTVYRMSDQLIYRKINMKLTDAYLQAIKSTPEVLDSEVEMKNNYRNYERILKENLPLPKLSVNLGAYRETMNQNGSDGSYNVANGGKDINLAASINMTWALTGQGGLFNSRMTGQARMEKELSERKYLYTKFNNEGRIQQIHQEVLNLEDQLEIYELQMETAQKTFDSVFENYTHQRLSYADYKNALINLRDTELNYEIAKFKHIERKVALSNAIGLDDLPGVNFEDLAKETL